MSLKAAYALVLAALAVRGTSVRGIWLEMSKTFLNGEVIKFDRGIRVGADRLSVLVVDLAEKTFASPEYLKNFAIFSFLLHLGCLM